MCNLRIGQVVYSQQAPERGVVLAREREQYGGGIVPDGFALIGWARVGNEYCKRDEFLTYDEIITREG